MSEYRIQISEKPTGSHYWLPVVVSVFCILYSDICHLRLLQRCLPAQRCLLGNENQEARRSPECLGIRNPQMPAELRLVALLDVGVIQILA